MEFECTICLESLTDSQLGVINQCKHFYHDHCILQWCKNSNSCPTCRRRFYNINMIKGSSNPDNFLLGETIKTVSVQDKVLPNDAINEIPREFVTPAGQLVNNNGNDNDNEIEHNGSSIQHNGICAICSSSDYRSSRNLIYCNNCNSKFHQRCIGITSTSGLANALICPMCDSVHELVFPINRVQNTRRIGGTTTTRRNRSQFRTSGFRASELLRDLDSRVNVEPELDMDIGIDHEDDYEFDYNVESVPAQSFSSVRRGLVIHNSNNEIDDAFLYSNDDDDNNNNNNYNSIPAPPVINGGVLLRKEAQQRENLTPDELKSWEMFDQVKNNDNLINNETNQIDSVPRRKRKKRSESQTMVNQSSLNVNAEPSRISSLMNQIKVRDEGLVGSSSGSSSGSPPSTFGGSPPSMASNLSPATSVDVSPPTSPPVLSPQQLPQQSTSLSASPSQSPQSLSLDQKSVIQFFIRNTLRPLYKDKIIKSEEDYININKSVSRKIYLKVLSLVSEGFELVDILKVDNENLQKMINGYIDIEIKDYKREISV